jgi:DNA-binding SARP family transcriptional activator
MKRYGTRRSPPSGTGDALAWRIVGAVEISLLGTPSVRREGAPVALETRKAMALLAHLALAERPRSRDALCELLWPGKDPDHARGALRRTLTTARKAVGPERIEVVADSVALRDGPGLEVDVRRFRSLVGPDATPADLDAAVALFRGDFLEGFALRDSPEFEQWCISEADSLQRELAGVLARLVAILAERGDLPAAIAHARRWLAVDPLHEPAHRELIRLYALNGDRAAALTQYRECVRTLSQELGVAPLKETSSLFEQVSEGTLVPPPPTPAAPRDHKRRAERPGELPLVGREAQLAALIRAHEQATLDGRLALIEGEAGIGKTRLARVLAAIAESKGATVLAAACHGDEAGLPYGPVVELLRQAAHDLERLASEVTPQRLIDASLLVPELAAAIPDPSDPAPPAGPAAQARLLEGIAEVLAAACAGTAPGLIFVDDVHAADEATVDLLAYFARRLRGRALLLALTWRSEGVPPGHRLRALAAELARGDVATVVALDRLGEREVATLVASAEHDGGPELERRVFIESEGLPLFVAEYLAAIAGGADLAAGALPGEMRDLLAARVGEVGTIARQLLETAAVIGRSFDLETLRLASGRADDEVVSGLGELVMRGLVRELEIAEPTYDFTHDKLRALVYEEIGRGRRRLLHRRVAGANLRETRRPENAALAAEHLRLAGDRAAAAEQHVRAAEHASIVLAHRDALEHLDAALALEHPEVAALRERIGDLRTLTGDYAGALSSYEAAAAEAADEDLARLEHKLGGVHQRRGEWDRAEARFAVALEAAGDGQDGLRARVLADLSLTSHHEGEREGSLELAERSRALAESAGDELAEAQAHNLIGVLTREGGEVGRARMALERSLELAERLDDSAARVAALNNLALLARAEGDLVRALALTEDALTLCAAQGDRHRQAALENNLADLHHEIGRADEAMDHLKRAVTIFAEVGGDESTRLPEIWKLVSW